MDPLQEQGTGIDKMEASREMDALVAERVMGWAWLPLTANKEQSILVPVDGSMSFPSPENTSYWWGRDVRDFVPHYSTDISAAWLVEERIAELGLIGKYCKHLNDIANARWDTGEKQGRSWQLIHATPEDRCRAALKAVGMVDVIGLGNG